MYYELTPVFDSHKSFYGKAHVEEDGNIKNLYSYHSLVCRIVNGKVEMLYGSMFDSMTTRRHKREFLLQNGFDDKEYM